MTTNAVKAGVLSFANNYVETKLDLKGADLTNTQIATRTITQTATQTAVYGGDFADNLLVNSVNSLQAKVSNEIGKNYGEGKNLNYVTHKLSHAVSGAVAAELQGKDAASGALLGAVTGEIVGEAVGKSLIQDGEFSRSDQDLVRLSSQLGTITTASVFDKDVDTALNSSNIAVENNTIYTYENQVIATDRIDNDKVIVLSEADKEKIEDAAIYDYQIDDDKIFKDTVSIVNEDAINNISENSTVYDLNSIEDFITLQRSTDMNYNNINKDTTIVAQTGMGNTYETGKDIQKMIQEKYPNERVGLITNETGTFSYLSDAIEWFSDSLTTKDVLNAYQYKQLSPETILLTHSAGNEDNYKGDKVNELLGVQTPYNQKSLGSPRSATSLQKGNVMVGSILDEQVNHQNDPVTIVNSDANYETTYDPINGSGIPFIDDLKKNHPFLNYLENIEINTEVQSDD